MKNIKNLLILGLSTLLIASCGAKPSNGAVTNSGSDTNTGSQDTGSTVDYGTFPFDAINAYVESTGVTVPGIVSSTEWDHGVATDDNGEYYYAETVDDDTTLAVENAYLAAVQAANWVCVNDSTFTYDEYGYIYDDPTEQVEVQFYTYNGKFDLFVSDLTNVYVSDINGIDLSTESQITKQSSSEVTWAFENLTMTVTKGTASVNVGNDTYLSNPLRLYGGNVVTFSWTDYSDFCLCVDVDTTSSKSTVEAGSDTSTGFKCSTTSVTVEVEDNYIYYIPDNSVSSFSITIGTKQCHWSSVEILFAE